MGTYTPTAQELGTVMKRLSIEGYGPTMSLFDTQRPPNWNSAKQIVKNTGILWREHLRMNGLTQNTPGKGKSFEVDTPPPKIATQTESTWGIECQPVRSVVVRWDWRRKAYRRVGWQLTYQAR